MFLGEFVPPEAWPVLPSMLIALGVMMGAIVCWGLTTIADNLVRALFGTVTGALGWIPWLGKVITRPINDIAQKLHHLIGLAERAFAAKVGQSFHDLAYDARKIGNLIIDTAATVFGLGVLLAQLGWKYSGLNALIDLIRGQVKTNAATQAHTARIARVHAKAQVKTEATVIHKTTVIVRDQVHWRGYTRAQIRRLVAQLAALGVATSATVATLPATLPGTIRRGIPAVWPRLRALERRIGVAGLTGIVAYALGRLGVSWIRCRNWRSIGRAGCNLPSDLLQALLGTAIEALVLADLCELVSGIETAALAFEPELRAFVDVEFALIGCRGATRPAAVPLAGLTFTPVVDAVVV